METINIQTLFQMIIIKHLFLDKKAGYKMKISYSLFTIRKIIKHIQFVLKKVQLFQALYSFIIITRKKIIQVINKKYYYQSIQELQKQQYVKKTKQTRFIRILKSLLLDNILQLQNKENLSYIMQKQKT
ncbi:hypothetical protein IMG5_157020 [Ichthyophthirius multifiliis]|uniref:Uncharacterized protein n=1 Tax=Ichthyophthirius multifiliis TaxID=5932 RepID=G0QZI6_ICHMU|nr:hypothetical protein IMG5_157020 [Ichthyophthirius multifiliis]EGR29375.1 hypothetical protein IMG5_157020 [Ichthyophthirius multifiliis]|eukprot:XP_004030611.1 hypothetical protein IMG5_157020 [Ichthyophthirius multifiliis]